MEQPSRIVVLDIETTALNDDPRYEPRPWEVAMAEITPGGDVNRWHLIVVDVDFTTANPASLDFTNGARARHPLFGAEAVPSATYVLEQTAAEVVEKVTTGAVIAANNPYFDLPILSAMLRRHGRRPMPWYYRPFDLASASIGHAWARGENTDVAASSSALAGDLGVTPAADTARHTALGDVLWNERWLGALQAAVYAGTVM